MVDQNCSRMTELVHTSTYVQALVDKEGKIPSLLLRHFCGWVVGSLVGCQWFWVLETVEGGESEYCQGLRME